MKVWVTVGVRDGACLHDLCGLLHHEGVVPAMERQHGGEQAWAWVGSHGASSIARAWVGSHGASSMPQAWAWVGSHGASSIARASYWKPSPIKSRRLMAACVHVIAMTLACFVRRKLPRSYLPRHQGPGMVMEEEVAAVVRGRQEAEHGLNSWSMSM